MFRIKCMVVANAAPTAMKIGDFSANAKSARLKSWCTKMSCHPHQCHVSMCRNGFHCRAEFSWSCRTACIKWNADHVQSSRKQLYREALVYKGCANTIAHGCIHCEQVEGQTRNVNLAATRVYFRLAKSLWKRTPPPFWTCSPRYRFTLTSKRLGSLQHICK